MKADTNSRVGDIWPTFKGVTAAFEWLESSEYKKEFPENSANAVGFKPVGPGCSFQSWLKDCGTGEVVTLGSSICTVEIRLMLHFPKSD